MSILREARNEFGAIVFAWSGEKMSPGQRGALIGALDKELGGFLNRKQYLKALTGRASSKDLQDSEWYALKTITGYGNMGGVWGFDPEAVQRMRACIEEAMRNENQLSMF